MALKHGTIAHHVCWVLITCETLICLFSKAMISGDLYPGELSCLSFLLERCRNNSLFVSKRTKFVVNLIIFCKVLELHISLGFGLLLGCYTPRR